MFVSTTNIFLPPDEVNSASTPYHYMSTCMVTTRSGKSCGVKSVKKRFQSKDFCNQLKLLTKTKGTLDEHWITPNFELSGFCSTYALGDDLYQRLLLDLSDFGLSLRTLACVLRVCRRFRSKGADIDYSLEKNIADVFCILVKADQSRFKPQNVKYLVKAECGVLFFIRHIVEVQNIFTSPHAVFLESNSVLLRKLFDFCHVQRGENRFQLNHLHNNGKITRNLVVNGSFATIFPNINM